VNARPPLRRATDGRLVAGVARGVAEHLGVDVWLVRAVFVVLMLSGGAGLLAYGALWVLVPLDDADPAERDVGGPAAASTATPGIGRERALALLLGAAGVLTGVVLLAAAAGIQVGSVWPLLVVGLGAALVWLQADEDQRDRVWAGVGRVAPEGRAGALQVGIGIALVLLGLVAFVVGGSGVADASQVLAAVVVVLLGVALLGAPAALRLMRERDAERRTRIRAEEKAELAAHVHDSVLQTLALIQRSADDPAVVSRLARAQERDLRRWLYAPVPSAGSSLRGALESVVAEVEDAHGVAVELVCVGDAPMDDRLSALVLAFREALVNAGKHAGGQVSVYAEAEPDQVAVFVRDRGTGFDPALVPDDRMGIRESIVGRMERNGGTAAVHSEPGGGTRIELRMGRTP
jgi:signal transduction histidine kinase